MDRPTLAAYEADARICAERWLAQDEPADLYALVRCYFRPDLTADIGCGMSSTTDRGWEPVIGKDYAQAKC